MPETPQLNNLNKLFLLVSLSINKENVILAPLRAVYLQFIYKKFLTNSINVQYDSVFHFQTHDYV